MSQEIRIQTSAEVIAVLRAKHSDQLVAFGSFTKMDEGVMQTDWGFRHAPHAFFRTRTTWDALANSTDKEHRTYEYWLLFTIEQEQSK